MFLGVTNIHYSREHVFALLLCVALFLFSGAVTQSQTRMSVSGGGLHHLHHDTEESRPPCDSNGSRGS